MLEVVDQLVVRTGLSPADPAVRRLRLWELNERARALLRAFHEEV